MFSKIITQTLVTRQFFTLLTTHNLKCESFSYTVIMSLPELAQKCKITETGAQRFSHNNSYMQIIVTVGFDLTGAADGRVWFHSISTISMVSNSVRKAVSHRGLH